MEPWTPLIVFHAFFAALALPLGAFQLLRPRRGDRWHVLVGRVWAVSIVLTSVPSFWIGGYSTFLALFLKFLAVVSIVSVLIGWISARRGDRANHAGFMTGAYLGLVGAFIGVITVPHRRIPSAFRVYPEEALFAVLAVLSIAAGILVVTRLASRQPQRPGGGRRVAGGRGPAEIHIVHEASVPNRRS
ncbi:DUF2306 domain-containing protein [Microbacteriaceae bacterium 4G12]